MEAATADAVAYFARFREVLEEGTLEQRMEFLRGFIAEIAIDPTPPGERSPSTNSRLAL